MYILPGLGEVMIVLSIIFVSDNLSSCVVGDKKYIVFGECKYREPVARELFAWSAVDHVTTPQYRCKRFYP